MAQLRPISQSTPQQPQQPKPPVPQLAQVSRIPTVRMFTGCTILFLVAVRIFIGWHFFIEGVYKLCQPDWRATSYLVASAGPMRETFRSLVKDVDAREALAIDQPEIMEGSELTGEKALALKTELHKRLQARLDRMFSEVAKYYGFDAAQANLASQPSSTSQPALAAQTDLAKQMVFANNLKIGLALKITALCEGNDPKPENKDLIAQIWDYKVLLDEIKLQEAIAKTSFDIQRKQEMYKRKAKVKGDLLTKVDKNINDLPVAIYKAKKKENNAEVYLLTEAQLAKGFMKTDVSPTRWIDISNMLGLAIVGLCLILGLFTRLACLGAVGLLAMYYAAMPPLPGMPESPMSEGHYLIINKNLIELATVLVLATTRVGRWCGLDGLIASKAKPAV